MRGSWPRREAASSPRALRERAFRLLAQRDHSRLELARKLGLEPESPLLAELAEAGYLDDRRFAESFVRWRRERGLGRDRILQELFLRGIDRGLAQELVGEDDFQRAVELAERRLQRARSRDQVLRFLLQRGFQLSLARRALEAASVPGDPDDE